jgi:hypothetical protein
MLKNKTIHQLWGGTRKMDKEYIEYSTTIQQNNPDWKYKLWSDTEALSELSGLIDDFKIPFNNYVYDIERWDVLRFLITYKFGGLICDLDMSCNGSINSLINDHNGFMYEKGICANISNRMLHQNFFYCDPEDMFIEHVMKCTGYSLSLAKGLDKREHVSTCIGPVMLTRSYLTYSDKANVNLINDDTIYSIITHHQMNLW